jgi:hypothetical protein
MYCKLQHGKKSEEYLQMSKAGQLQEYKYILLKQLKIKQYFAIYLLLKTEKKVTDLVKCKHKTFVDYL